MTDYISDTFLTQTENVLLRARELQEAKKLRSI